MRLTLAGLPHPERPRVKVHLGSAVAILILTLGTARAEADLPPNHPMQRPLTFAATPIMRPMPRPLQVAVAPPDEMRNVRPMPRPELPIKTVAMKPTPQKPASGSLKGALCQRADIKGKALAPITARNKGCNVADPVLVSEISGVRLVPPATINCDEARAVSDWITTGLQPAFGNTVVRLNVADSYACRPRNNVPGNPVSVHGLGQAIDIAGFVTSDGRSHTVADNYGPQIKAAQKAGCGIFHTILGPGSDGYHESHIHFDVAQRRGSAYCR